VLGNCHYPILGKNVTGRKGEGGKAGRLGGGKVRRLEGNKGWCKVQGARHKAQKIPLSLDGRASQHDSLSLDGGGLG